MMPTRLTGEAAAKHGELQDRSEACRKAWDDARAEYWEAMCDRSKTSDELQVLRRKVEACNNQWFIAEKDLMTFRREAAK